MDTTTDNNNNDNDNNDNNDNDNDNNDNDNNDDVDDDFNYDDDYNNNAGDADYSVPSSPTLHLVSHDNNEHFTLPSSTPTPSAPSTPIASITMDEPYYSNMKSPIFNGFGENRPVQLMSDIDTLFPDILSQDLDLDRIYSENQNIASFGTRYTTSHNTKTNEEMVKLYGDDKWFSKGYRVHSSTRNGPTKRNPYVRTLMNGRVNEINELLMKVETFLPFIHSFISVFIHFCLYSKKVESCLNVVFTTGVDNAEYPEVIDPFLLKKDFRPSNFYSSSATSNATITSLKNMSVSENSIVRFQKIIRDKIFNNLKQAHHNAILLRQVFSNMNKNAEQVLSPSTPENFEKLHFLFTDKHHTELPASSEFTECVICKETNCKSYVFIKRRCSTTICNTHKCKCKQKMCYHCAVKNYWVTSDKDQKSSGKCPTCNAEYCLKDLEVFDFTEDTAVVEELEKMKSKNSEQQKEIEELKKQLAQFNNIRVNKKSDRRSKTKENRKNNSTPYGRDSNKTKK